MPKSVCRYVGLIQMCYVKGNIKRTVGDLLIQIIQLTLRRFNLGTYIV